MKLWHDDVRRPPDDSWIWCRTNSEAIDKLTRFEVTRLSMDHDLGGSQIPIKSLSNADLLKLEGNETGVDLARWIASSGKYPSEIIVHSMNTIGATNIVNALLHTPHQVNCEIKIEPFRR